MSHMNLADYYAGINGLVDHKYSKSDIDAMYPFERDVIISLLNQATKPAAEVVAPTEF